MFDAGQIPYSEIDAFEPGDQQVGEWTFEERLLMNERFVARVRRAIALGLECCSRPAGNQALEQMDSKEKLCAHCGDVFVPRRRDTLYCSMSCNQMSYHSAGGNANVQQLTPSLSPPFKDEPETASSPAWLARPPWCRSLGRMLLLAFRPLLSRQLSRMHQCQPI
jgi:hypothetical protein